MSELRPEGWKQTNLASLGEYLNGFAFNDEHWSEQGLPIVRIAQITGSQGIVDRYPGRLPDTYLLNDGELIFSWSGTLTVVRWFGGSAWLNQHLFKVVNHHNIDKSFLFHVLRSSVVEMNKRTHGSTMKHIKRGELQEFQVDIPIKLGEQQQIAQVLDTLDTVIHKTEAIIEKLKQVKQGLLHDLLTRGVDANGQLRPSYEQAPHLYKQSPLGWIPKEWSVDRLFNSCSLIRDGTHLPPVRVNTGPLLLSVRNMKDGKLVLTDDDTRISNAFYVQMHKHWSIEKGDVLLAIVGATIGKIAQVGDMPKFTLQRSVAILRGKKERLQNRFMLAYMGSHEFKAELWAQVNQTAQPGIYLDQLGSINIPLPPVQEQQVLGERLSAAENQISYEEAYLGKLKTQKSGLMDDLLTGRVRVTSLLKIAAP
ncbi:MAG: restriction endonuclease subunit S [Gallionella sp.]|nr:restriction endonuclease subunit S [Gallionella sp.]MDD4958743.1 restriction endonuclease subunit S [Gallionella sp.]